MFQIVRLTSTYCQITDAQIGYRIHIENGGMTYRSRALAWKLAGIKSRDNFEAGGDDYYEVRDANGRRALDPWPMTADSFDDIPF